MNKTKIIILLLIIIVKISETYSLCAHASKFGTDQACHDYLVQVRWNGIPQCPACENNHMNYYLSKRKVYKCSKCYKQFSVIQGTIFEKTRIPLSKWFLAIYLFTTKKRGISSCQMAKWLGIRQPAAWLLLHKLRAAMKDENEIILSGIVEADETFVTPKTYRDMRLLSAKRRHEKEQDIINGISNGKRLKEGEKKTRGRKKGETKEILEQRKLEALGKEKIKKHISNRVPFDKGAVIFGMAEQRGRIVMKILGIDSRSVTKDNIYPHLTNHITSNSVLITDQLNLYNDASEIFAQHLKVNHNLGYVINGVHTCNIDNVWKHLKKMIDGTYFHISYRHFSAYLHENTYRWNRREKSEMVLFEDFFPLTIGKRVSYEQLTCKENKLAA